MNQLIYNEQHTDGNAENHDREMLTLPMEKNKNAAYQGMKTQTPKLVKNNQISQQGRDAKRKLK